MRASRFFACNTDCPKGGLLLKSVFRKLFSPGIVAALCLSNAPIIQSQELATAILPAALTSSSLPGPELPDAPMLQGETVEVPHDLDALAEPGRTPVFAPKPVAPLYNKYIERAQRAQPLTGFRRSPSDSLSVLPAGGGRGRRI